MKEKAQKGLSLLMEAVLELLEKHPKGLTNTEIARELDIRSQNERGTQKDWFSYYLLLMPILKDKVEKKDKRYLLKDYK